MDWNNVFSFIFITNVLAGGVALSTPLVLAALGEVFTERSGVLNLGMEGIMILSALTAFSTALHTENAWFGLIVGMLTGGLMGALFAFLTITLRANQIVTAFAITIFGTGLALFLFRLETSASFIMPSIETIKDLPLPFLSTLPILGKVFFSHDIITYLMFLMVPISAIILYKTPLGLRITAVGELPESADTLGVSVVKIRYICVIIGSILVGLAGAYLTVASFGFFNAGVAGGRGYIAVAIVAFGRWNPYWVMGGGILFGIIDALQSRLQILGAPIPPNFLLMLPYIFTVLMLMLAKEAKAPAALTQPYSRE